MTATQVVEWTHIEMYITITLVKRLKKDELVSIERSDTDRR
jgi:hypothetical protein